MAVAQQRRAMTASLPSPIGGVERKGFFGRNEPIRCGSDGQFLPYAYRCDPQKRLYQDFYGHNW